MIDIGNYFKFTEDSVSNWKHQQVGQILEILVHTIEGTIIDWEPGDEEWARLLVGQELVAIICAKIPLVIARETYKDKILTYCIKQEIKILFVRDFDEEKFCIEKELLEEIFGRKMTTNISYDALSISDVWWATVT